MGGWGGEGVAWVEVMGVGGAVVMVRREKLFIIIGGTHMNISYMAMTRRRVTK